MTLRSIVRDLAPPALVRLARRSSADRLRWAGHPLDWQAAVLASSGYAASDILARVSQATEQVVSGGACFERDSVAFYRPEYPFPLVTALLDEAVRHRGKLDVVDFGGSLGSAYWQCRPMLESLLQLRWHVVEQAHFVDTGRQRFSSDQLRFYGSLSEACANASPSVALASSVLQYLPDPYDVLEKLAATGATTLVIDRTPVSDLATDRLCIQHVPPSIYSASYPCWIFSRQNLMERLEKHWSLRAEFPCAEGAVRTDDGAAFSFVGLIMRRKS